MVPHDAVRSNEVTKVFTERQGYMTMWMGDDRRLIMYPCSDNTVMNFVAIHPSAISAGANKGSGKSEQSLGNGIRSLIGRE